MIRWTRTDYTDGFSEVLTLCRVRGNYVIQITSGPDVGDDFVVLYNLDRDQISLGNDTWEAVDEAPQEVLGEIEQNYKYGTWLVKRMA